MGTLSIAMRALDGATRNSRPHNILELGAGDGSMMLRLAQRRAANWPGVKVTLLDRLDLVDTATLSGLRNAGWTADVVAMDVFEWLAKPVVARWDIIFANLFMHHFSPEALDQHCLDRIARFKRPKRYVFVASLPKNSYGKVLKRELQQTLAGNM